MLAATIAYTSTCPEFIILLNPHQTLLAYIPVNARERLYDRDTM